MTDKQFYQRLWWIVVAVSSIIFYSVILTMATACEDVFIAGYNKEFEKIDSLMLSVDSIMYDINMLIDSTDWNLFYQKAQRINNGS